MLKTVLASLIAVSSLATAARAETVAPIADWSGFHIGIGAAAQRGDNQWRQTLNAAEKTRSDRWSGRLKSLSAGYDWQSGRLVYGLAAEVTGGRLNA